MAQEISSIFSFTHVHLYYMKQSQVLSHEQSSLALQGLTQKAQSLSPAYYTRARFLPTYTQRVKTQLPLAVE